MPWSGLLSAAQRSDGAGSVDDSPVGMLLAAVVEMGLETLHERTR